MSIPARTGAVIFAKDSDLVATFYREVLQARQVHSEPGYLVLQHEDIELGIHAIPPHIASTFEVSSPPAPREDAAIKLFFPVVGLDDACDSVNRLGGVVHGRVWHGKGFTACDVTDPEGNVIQLRAGI